MNTKAICLLLSVAAICITAIICTRMICDSGRYKHINRRTSNGEATFLFDSNTGECKHIKFTD